MVLHGGSIQLISIFCIVVLFLIGLYHHSTSCLGPPYLMATFHGGLDTKNQVHLFSRDGCVLNSEVLQAHNRRELRGMQLLDDGKLIVNNAYSGKSAVLLFDQCDTYHSSRKYLATIAGSLNTTIDVDHHHHLLHPYGVVSYQSRVYITNQDTCSITSYSLNSLDQSTDDDYNEVLIDEITPCDQNKISVRGIAFDSSGIFYVAIEELGIYVYDANENNNRIGTIECSSCIGVLYDRKTNTIFAGSSGDNLVHQFEVWPKINKITTFGHVKLIHPAGLTIYDNILYVASQRNSQILSFDVQTNQCLGTVIATHEDPIEDIILSPC